MTTTKKMCGVCYQPFSANVLRWSPDKVKKVCRPCFAQMTPAPAPAPAPEPPPMLWYVVCVGIECDVSVVKDMKREILIQGLGARVGKVYAPTHVVQKIKDRKMIRQNVLSFPGYILVQCRWSEEVHHFIKGTRNVYGVLPLAPTLYGKRYNRKEPPTLRKPVEWEKEKTLTWAPTALATEEAALLLLREQHRTEKKAPVKVECKIGDKVTLTGGTFAGMEGVVKGIDGTRDNPYLTVTVVMWGRNLDVKVAAFEMEKL